MNNAFSPFSPPFAPPFGGHPGGFGFGPQERRALHEAHRQARRDFRAHLRGRIADHAAGSDGPAGFGPGFGPGFVPGGPGFGFGPGARGGWRGPGRSRRGRRGDVRSAILVLLAERPMHGYEMIQEIAERSQDLWRPSPGSVYPTLQLLVDEGLITGSETEGNKRLFELTPDGRTVAEKVETPPWVEIAEGDPGQVDLRKAVRQLFGAVVQSTHAASAEQQQRIVDIVNKARREVYTILSESE